MEATVGSRAARWVVLGLLMCMWGASSVTSAEDVSEALTVWAAFDFTSELAARSERIDILTITPADSSVPLLTLQWQKESSPFGFSMWRVCLLTHEDLAKGMEYAVETTPSGPGILIDRFLPTSDETYLVTVSYDGVTGNVAVDLEIKGGASVKSWHGKLGTSLRPLSARTGDYALLRRTEPTFLPLGTHWELVAGSHKSDLMPTIRVSQHDVAAARLNVPYADLGAKLRLVGVSETEQLTWAESDALAGELVVPLDVQRLSPGPWYVGLELVRDEMSWPLGSPRSIHITQGIVTATTDGLVRRNDVVQGAIRLSGDGFVPDLHVQLVADIHRLDSGEWQLVEENTVLYEAVLDVNDEVTLHAFNLGDRIPADSAHNIALRIVAAEGQEVTMVSKREEHFLPVGESGYMGGIPQIDVAGEESRLTVIDHIPGQYLGHPDTVLLEDGRTILVVYPLEHGGPTVLRRSTDGGVTWSERLPVPESWSRTADVPTIFRTVDDNGTKRLIVFQNMVQPGKEPRPTNRQNTFDTSISLDDGATWTEFAPAGLPGQVSPNTMIPISGGRYLIVFQLNAKIEMAITSDGGQTWHSQRTIASHPNAALTEPAAITSPDGKEIAVLIRENSRKHNSMLIVSKDEGRTWSAPVELPDTLTGDRHKPVYAPDGRLVITLRDVMEGSPTYGDFVAWVGTYDDLVNLRPGQYRVRLLENKRNWWDTGYAGLELLPDGTFVSTTYVPLTYGAPPSVVSLRFTLDEFDAMVAEQFGE